MQILVAVDQNPYSAHAVDEAAKLAANTWANVSLMGVRHSGGPSAGDSPGHAATDPTITDMLFEQRTRFLSHFDPHTCPYLQPGATDGPNEAGPGDAGMHADSPAIAKTLTIQLRIGNTGKEILAEAREAECDLIVMGCDGTSGCGWAQDGDLPRKVAIEAPCSVLVVKRNANVKRILCCLDHDHVSQASLEMLNQMVTLYQAQLTIIGLADSRSLKGEVETKMKRILSYYQARNIDPWIELVDPAALDTFIARESRWGLMALWMGKSSILEKIFPRSRVDKLIRGGDASVLILR
jgi:nucleotide-binding universal stress UspA family protein